MRQVGVVCGAAILLAGLSGPARAQQVVATRPGIMCVSAETLGRLTLPNGDSRTHDTAPRPRSSCSRSTRVLARVPAVR